MFKTGFWKYPISEETLPPDQGGISEEEMRERQLHSRNFTPYEQVCMLVLSVSSWCVCVCAFMSREREPESERVRIQLASGSHREMKRQRYLET